MIKVVLVGMNNLFLQGLRHLLDPSAVLGRGRGARPRRLVRLRRGGRRRRARAPDLLVADLNGCSEHDLDSLQGVRATCDELRIVVLANELCLTDMARLLKAGVDGYLLKDLSARSAVAIAAAGDEGREGAAEHAGQRPRRRRPRTSLANGAAIRAQKHLTEREEQILRCLLNAYSNKHIARALNISEGTVKVHLKSLMKKIAAGNRTQAALWARNNGIADGELVTGRP